MCVRACARACLRACLRVWHWNLSILEDVQFIFVMCLQATSRSAHLEIEKPCIQVIKTFSMRKLMAYRI